MFLGIADSVSDLKGDSATESHTLFHIDEVFLGLPSTQKQVVVNFQGDWIERGKSYLIDGQRDEKGEVHPSICGASGEAEERYTSELLDFLRQRGSGKAPTSLSVYVEDDSAGIPDVDVTITNGKQAWTKTTDAEGFAEFTVPEPGKYTISAQKRFYALDPEMKSDLEVEVLVGSCSGGRVTLRAQGEVAGSVQNAQTTPVSGLHLQLLSVSDSKREDLGDIGTLPKRMQQVSFTFSRYLLDVTTSEQTFVSFRHTRTSCALSILAFAKKRMPRLSKSNWISLKRA